MVREFVRAFNEGDLDAFVATLDPEIRLHSMKGMVEGISAARKWATRAEGGAQQTVIVNEAEVIGEEVLLRIRRDWHWAEDGTLAGSDEMAWLFLVRDDKILSWRPFADTAEARAELILPS